MFVAKGKCYTDCISCYGQDCGATYDADASSPARLERGRRQPEPPSHPRRRSQQRFPPGFLPTPIGTFSKTTERSLWHRKGTVSSCRRIGEGAAVCGLRNDSNCFIGSLLLHMIETCSNKYPRCLSGAMREQARGYMCCCTLQNTGTTPTYLVRQRPSRRPASDVHSAPALTEGHRDSLADAS